MWTKLTARAIVVSWSILPVREIPPLICEEVGPAWFPIGLAVMRARPMTALVLHFGGVCSPEHDFAHGMADRIVTSFYNDSRVAALVQRSYSRASPA